VQNVCCVWLPRNGVKRKEIEIYQELPVKHEKSSSIGKVFCCEIRTCVLNSTYDKKKQIGALE